MPSTWTASGSVVIRYVQAKPYGTSLGNLKVHCPSLMPLIPMDTPKVTSVGLSKVIFKNAPDCAITIPSQIKTQNYFTALKARSPGYAYMQYDFGAEMSCEPIDRFMQSARLTTTIDNSTFH